MADFLNTISQGLTALGTGRSFADVQSQQEKRDFDKSQQFLQLDKQRQGALFQDAQAVNTFLKAGQTGKALDTLSNRINLINGPLGGDPSDSLEITGLIESGDIKGAQKLLDSVEKVGIQQGFLKDPRVMEAALAKSKGGSAESRSFDKLLEGLTPDEKAEAILIKLGLSPRAVGSAIQTINDQGIAEEIGNVKKTIRQREKFGELTATRRSKVIDSGFNKIEKINIGLNNLDRAVSALQSGAGVGAIEKFLPSFKAASVELDNIRSSMALDVVGATTFGALSAGELALAKDVALPTGLDTPQLIDYLTRRKAAQEKLRAYYNEQIQFLDQGGTIAGFLRKKERDSEQQTTGGNEFTGFKVVR